MKKKEILRNSCRYEIVKDTLQPTNISPNSPLQKQRKLLQKVQVGKGIMLAIQNLALPYINCVLKRGLQLS